MPTVNVVRRLPKNLPSKDFWPSLKMLWLQRFSFSVKLIYAVSYKWIFTVTYKWIQKVNTVNVVRKLPKNLPSKDFWPSLKMLWLQRFSFSVKLIFTVASICLQLKSKCTFKATTWILKLSKGPSISGVDSFFRF